MTKKTDFHAAGAPLLCTAVGREIVGLRHARKLFNDRPDDSDMDCVELEFSDGYLCRLEPAPDGESVRVEHGAVRLREAYDMDSETRCSYVKRDLLLVNEFARLRGGVVSRVDAIVVRCSGLWFDEETISGWRIAFESGDNLTYFVDHHADARLLESGPVPSFGTAEVRLVSLRTHDATHSRR
jgi:hypothetical protein